MPLFDNRFLQGTYLPYCLTVGVRLPRSSGERSMVLLAWASPYGGRQRCISPPPPHRSTEQSDSSGCICFLHATCSLFSRSTLSIQASAYVDLDSRSANDILICSRFTRIDGNWGSWLACLMCIWCEIFYESRSNIPRWSRVLMHSPRCMAGSGY